MNANVKDRHSIMAIYPLERFEMDVTRIRWRPRPSGMGC
jgi:hypothetical protein